MGKYTEVCKIVFDEKIESGKILRNGMISCTILETNEMIHKAIGLKLGYIGHDLLLVRPFVQKSDYDKVIALNLRKFEALLEMNLKSMVLRINDIFEKIGQ